MIRPRDYLVTDNDLYFAVVSGVIEEGRYLCSLRYAVAGGVPRKLSTAAATRFLSRYYPDFLYHSKMLDVPLHGVPKTAVARILKPAKTVDRLLTAVPDDRVGRHASQLVTGLLSRGVDRHCLGITGSLLPGFHNDNSDIDVVVYGLDAFLQVREHIRHLCEQNAHALTPAMWLDAWNRRGCTLDFERFFRHEQRKCNKLNWFGTKVDFSCIPDAEDSPRIEYPVVKLSQQTIQTVVSDDARIFSYPARYGIDHPDIDEILGYTATYTGQAFRGEHIEASGQVERDANGVVRMVVGTSREAAGEYIMVIGEP